LRFMRDTTSVIIAQSIITKVNKSLKEGIRMDSFEVAQSRDGLPRSKIEGRKEAELWHFLMSSAKPFPIPER
jgi:hypothetical protein